ncbi:MAG: cobyrinic Acid a,c-diamide synthase ParA [Proteobacteria bacterium]|nr:cobyrinic Acid a,c-diamide synthase ParA [Pseudomonadota bacterium]
MAPESGTLNLTGIWQPNQSADRRMGTVPAGPGLVGETVPMGAGPIIVVATLKGGSGKSTLASSLAVHWRLAGRTPVLIDADPQRSLVRLAAREEALAGVPVFENCRGTVVATADQLAQIHAPVLIDTAGFRTAATLAAMTVADLVILPVKPSPLDVDVMLDTARALLSSPDGRSARFRCVLTQTTRDSVISRHIRAELTSAGFPLFETELVNRVAYGEAALFGATPSMIDPHGAAAREIAALASEIDSLAIEVEAAA